jgi:hypothetical protein
MPLASNGAAIRLGGALPRGRAAESGAEVPDTLDLIENGKHALNALAGTLDRGEVPEFYFRVLLRPPTFIHDRNSFAACGPKYWEAFVMLRAMTGSDQFQDIQERYRRYLLSCIEGDGLFYSKIGPQRPWDTSSPEDYANIYGQGRMIRALIAEYDHDGNLEWLARARKMANRLAEIGIYNEDYVYFPTTPGYGDMFSYPKSGWKVTARPTRMPFISSPWLGGPESFTLSFFGIPMYLGGTILPLVRLAERTGDEKILELAVKLTRFLLLPESAWLPSGYARGVTPGEHGEYRGVTHGHVMALRGILATGVATNGTNLKNFARDGYEFSRNLGMARLGWFESTAGKHSHETCTLADMTSLALQLSEAGLGDYWDDVDGFVRNHLTEGQYVSLEKMKSLNHPLSADEEKLLLRAVGTYTGWGSPVALSTAVANCCTANGSQGLYAAWEKIVTYEKASGAAQVNLLLNRTSPWLEVESYLPYEGKVILRNKEAQRVYVRIPAWVDRNQLRCDVDGQAIVPRYLGNYLLLDPVSSPSVIKVTFPLREEVQTYSFEDYGYGGWSPTLLGRYRYRVTFKGNTAITVESLEGDQTRTYDGERLDVTPVYTAYDDRGYLGKDTTPLKKRTSRSSWAKDIRSW